MAEEMQWYRVRQNNSGGSFDYEPSRGISVELYIQAPTLEQALSVQERVGAMDNYGSCSCCGDRWHEVSNYDAVESEQVPEKDAVMVIDKNDKNHFSMKWMEEGKYEAFVHPWEEEFYGAWGELKVIPRTMTGYGLKYSEKSVGEIFPVSEDGWTADGNTQVPSPTASKWGSGRIIVDEPHLRIEEMNWGGLNQYSAWAREKGTLEKLQDRARTYVEIHAKDAMDVAGMAKGL